MSEQYDHSLNYLQVHEKNLHMLLLNGIVHPMVKSYWQFLAEDIYIRIVLEAT